MTKRIRKGVKLGRRTVNKSEQIREAAKMMVAQGKPPRPIEILEILGEKGIKVTSGQVSLALSGTELSLKHHNAGRPPAALLPDPAKTLPLLSFKELEETRDFVRKLGSAEKALAAISIIGKLKQTEPEENERK